MACDDNTAAFTQLYEKHADYVYGIALSFLRSAADAEDVTSDVFMQVYESRMQFQDDGHARAWLTVAVRNRCKNHLKSWVRRKRADLQEAENLPADAAHPEVREAMDAAGATTKSIGLIEADGSGVADMEEREIAAIQSLWGEHRPGSPLVGIGSVKGNIGHTIRASMAAGLVKTALALHSRVLPPQLAPEVPSEKIDNLSSSAYLLTEARPWITGDPSKPRQAAVIASNFNPVNPSGGMGRTGRSAAIVREEEPENRV